MTQSVLSPSPRGRPLSLVIPHPEARWSLIVEPESFQEALDLQMTRHADTAYGLHAAIRAAGCSLAYSSLLHCRRGRGAQGGASLKAVEAIENRYRPAPGYFLACLARGWESICCRSPSTSNNWLAGRGTSSTGDRAPSGYWAN